MWCAGFSLCYVQLAVTNLVASLRACLASLAWLASLAFGFSTDTWLNLGTFVRKNMLTDEFPPHIYIFTHIHLDVTFIYKNSHRSIRNLESWISALKSGFAPTTQRGAPTHRWSADRPVGFKDTRAGSRSLLASKGAETTWNCNWEASTSLCARRPHAFNELSPTSARGSLRVSILLPQGPRLQSILNPFWIHIESMLNPYCIHIASILNPYCVHIESMLNPYWIHFESILNPYWIHVEAFWRI